MRLYHVFSLSLREVELNLAERGIMVTHESIRHWCLKFRQEATPTTAAARRHLASRRGVHPHPGFPMFGIGRAGT
jgi:transposase-like protein